MNVQIEQTTLNKIRKQLAEDTPNNIRAGYLTGKIYPEKVIVEGIYVPKQESNTIMTTITPEEQLAAFQTLKSDGKTVVGCIQYNGHFAAFESTTTKKFRETLSKETGVPNLAVIVNSRDDYKIFQ